MQEMFSAVCDGARIGDEGRLEDERDGKVYWVAKLKDNNCWMTQNLDLDLKTTKPLTSTDSDVTSDWTPSEDTQTTASPSFTTSGYNVVQSWDPAQGGAEKYCSDNTTSKCDLTNSQNDGHDAQGNYYSWAAVTAGQAVTLTTGQQSTHSICPKGWRLPLSGDNNGSNNTISESFYNLVNGLTVAQITVNPYYFIYGGYVDNSNLIFAGSYGRYWSSVAGGSNAAYALAFTTSVNPSLTQNRYLGLSVRCVAR